MQRFVAFLILFTALWLGAVEPVSPAGAPSFPELRGAWIHSPKGTADWGWDKTVKALADNGFNALFANFSWTVSADYPSQYSVPAKWLVNPDGTCRDCLQECLDACRKYGVELHVWVVVCNMGDHTPAEVRRAFQEAGRTQVDAEGKPSDYLMPQHPENQQLLQDVLTELVTKYPVDGVHLDYIRYPFGAYDCSEVARRDFEAILGRPVENWPQDILPKGALRKEYRQWCRGNITQLVRLARQVLKKAAPDVQLSAAVYGHWPSARESVAQDAAAWVDEGLVDFLCPMNYSGSPWEAGAWLRQQLAVVQGRVPIYSGLANYMCDNVGILQQEIQDTRVLGSDGFICFQLKEDFASQWLPVLKETVTGSAVPVPADCVGPRPVCQWHGGSKPSGACYCLWRPPSQEMVVCEISFPGEKAFPREDCRPVLFRNGEPCPLKYAIRWRGNTLRLAFRPKQRGYYRWRLVFPEAVYPTTTWLVR